MTCSSCSEPCEAKWVDFGIGPYEYWGFTGVDKRMLYSSSCCEADVLDDDGNVITDPGEPIDLYD